MIEIHDRVFVGSEQNCMNGADDWAVVHAFKSLCHQRAVGYDGKMINGQKVVYISW